MQRATQTQGPLRILTLFVRHGTDRYPHAESTLESIYRERLPETEWTRVTVDNALMTGTVHETSEHELLLGGDNEHWEFSGWNHALAHIGDRIWSYDWVHLATSAFDTLYTGFLTRFSTRMLRAAQDRPVCIGHVDCYDEAVSIGAFRSQHWMRTSFFFVPPSELKALGSLVSSPGSRVLFTDDPTVPFRADAPLSVNYRKYLLDWLTRSGTGQGVKWHSRFDLDETSLPLFQKKVEAILNEHMLSVRLRALGCRIIDVTWLASKLSSKAPYGIAWETPWRRQLSERDVDKVIPSS